MKKKVSFLVLSAISMAIIAQATPAIANQVGDEKPERIRSEEEHSLLSDALKNRILKTSFSNCTVKKEKYVTLTNVAGRWLGLYFGSIYETRIWRKQIGSQPVLELETHLRNGRTRELEDVPSEVLRARIFTDPTDSKITSILLSREEGIQVDVGTVSRPKIVNKLVVVEAIDCAAMN